MPKLKTVFAVLLLLLAFPTLAQVPGGWLYRGSDITPDPAWKFGTLENGLRYAVRRNPLPAGQVAIRIRIDAGALHEEDGERGWAHYVEHMLFRGTERFPDRRAREIWQELGASFGSDSNARTTPTETVYQLDLPHAERAALDTSLEVLADMMARARFEPAAVNAERPVVLAEKGRRPELTQRMREIADRLFHAGLRFGERDTIGTDATLNAATAPGLRAFYERWYRPERTTIVMVGDADPAMMEELIRNRFGSWRSRGPAPSEPDYGRIAAVEPRVGNIAYPGVPTTASVAWLRPYVAAPHTRAREQIYMAESLAERIINRRLESHARRESAYLNASLDTRRTRNVAHATQLSITAREGRWAEAVNEAFAILADARLNPPSAAEIEREIRNLRTSIGAAIQGVATVRSTVFAEQLVNALDRQSVVATPDTVLANFEASVPLMTPERVGAAMRSLFEGATPRMIVASPTPIETSLLTTGLAGAEASAPAARSAERQVSFDDLPRFGAPGREISRQHIGDLDVWLVRFANGSSLSFKRTHFERGSVQVRLRFGNGMAGLAPDRPSLTWLGGLIPASGMAGLDLEAMERLLTGRRIGLAFRVEEDSFVLLGQTEASSLTDQLRLLSAKLTHPEWDPGVFSRFRQAAVQTFDLHDSSASRRAGREMGSVMRPNDQRWRPIDREEMAAARVEAFRDYFAPLLAQGPINAVIVGDVELDQAIEAVRTTIGSLPPRAEPTAAPGSRDVRPPSPNPVPRRFTHNGDPNQAFALIGWSTLGGRGNIRERRALALAANMFQVRLFDRLREQEGVAYSPDASHVTAAEFPAWGVFQAAAEMRPDRVATFFATARALVADLAARPAAADEFARAQNPVISGIERTIATNGYWSGVIGSWIEHPEEIENVRNYIADYRRLTPEDVRRAVATYVTDQGDWSMVVLPARGAAPTEGTGSNPDGP
jgi:zinc protease